MIKFIAINSKYVHTLLAPYYLKENCDFKQKIEIVQCNINQDIKDIYTVAISDCPKVVAMPCYIFNINCVVALSKLLKKNNPDILIVFGGPEASYENEDLLEICDFLITGEGEIAFNELICDLEANSYSKVGLNQIYVGKNANLKEVKSPYSVDYFKDVNGKIAYFEASRGCPYSCAYCMSGNSCLRCFELERVKKELLLFEGKQIRVLKFVDRTFNANKAFAKEILRFLIEHKDKFSFGFHFEIAADILDDEFIELVNISPNGLFQFEVGVQSFNEKTLELVARKTSLDKVILNLQKLIATGKAHIHTDLIAGLPLEDFESFKCGFEKLYAINSNMLQLGFLKVLKGSRLKSMIDDRYVFEKNPPYEIISTPYISKEQLQILKYVEEGCDKYHNSGQFKRTLKEFVLDKPFDFFFELGKRIYNRHLSLFERIEILFDFLCEKFDVQKVKGIMTYDYMSVNNSRILPDCLKSDYDKSFSKMLKCVGIDKKQYFAKQIDINPVTYEKGNFLLYVDYNAGYDVKFINLDEVKKLL